MNKAEKSWQNLLLNGWLVVKEKKQNAQKCVS